MWQGAENRQGNNEPMTDHSQMIDPFDMSDSDEEYEDNLRADEMLHQLNRELRKPARQEDDYSFVPLFVPETDVLHPDSTFATFWVVSLSFVTMVDCLLSLVVLAWEPDDDSVFGVLLWIVDILFFLNMCISFHLAYWESVDLITDRQEITKKYLSFWFWVDALSTIPWHLMEASKVSLLSPCHHPLNRHKS